MKKSIFSIISFVIGLWYLLAIFTQIIPVHLFGNGIYLALIGIVAGIIGLAQHESKKTLAIIGIVFCAIFMVWGIFMVKNMGTVQPIENY